MAGRSNDRFGRLSLALAGARPNQVVRSKLSQLLADVEPQLVEAAEHVWRAFADHKHTQGAAERMLEVGADGHGAGHVALL